VSSVQERLYYNHALRKESITYNLTIALEMKGGLEIRKTERILRELIARHEALRTDFKIENGELRQVVHDTVEFNLEETHISDEHIQEAIARYIQPFDLAKAPLMKAGFVATNGGKQILVVDFHHIICDGMSQMILFLEFLKLYSGDELTPISVHLKDYAEWEWSFRSSGEYLSHREFWLERFEAEIPRIELPVAGSGNEVTSDKGGNIFFQVDKEDISLFINYLHDNGLTNFSGLFCLYFIFLCQLTGQEDLVIGIAASGRMQEELENVVGTFVKTLPIRYKLDPNILLSDLLKDISNYLIQANSRQIYDLSNIMIDLNSKHQHKPENLFDVLFVYQDFDRDHVEKDNYAMYRVDNGSSKYPLSLFIIDIGASFTFRMEYMSAYFTDSDAEILAEQLKGLVWRVSEKIDTRVIDIIGLNQEVPNLAEDDLSFNF
jgi:mycobactin peptide synthetase MbtE